jgi:hypothetical protein
MATFDLTTPEVWYPIPGHPLLEISSHFRVRSWHLQGSWKGRRAPEPRIKKVQGGRVELGRRYLHIIVPKKGGGYTVLYLHHVVAELAHGPRPEGKQVLHRDDDKRNLNPSNLYYGTSQDNAEDRARNGKNRRICGEDKANTILTDDAVRAIRAAWDARPKTYGSRRRLVRELATRFGIAPKTVEGIGERRRWTHVL